MERHHKRPDTTPDKSQDRSQKKTGSKTVSSDPPSGAAGSEVPTPVDSNNPKPWELEGTTAGDGKEQALSYNNETNAQKASGENVPSENATIATTNSDNRTTDTFRENTNPAQPAVNSQTESKPVNGMTHNFSIKEPTTRTDTTEEDEQQKKAHALLSRAVLRKVNSAKPETKTKKEEKERATEGKQQEGEEEESEEKLKAQALFNTAVLRRLADRKPPVASTQPASLDLNSSLNSSAGAKSLNSSSSSHNPRPAHKTQSMQSLAVPAAGVIGPTPMEADDRVSVGSRRDSVRQSMDSSSSRKSVDYRLQTSQAVVVGGGGEEKAKSVMWHDDSMIRAAIPALPLPLAVLCLVLNVVIPGSGTVVSGVSVLCCSKSRLSSKGDAKATTVCLNLFVGAAQLATVTFLLVGWFWSLAWGVKMLILAVEHREELRQQREKELQALALRAFGSPGNMRRLPV